MDGGSLHAQVLGPDGAPAIVLLHGSGASTHSWRAVMDLAASDFRVVALDLPGHGHSPRQRGARPNLPNVARAVAQALERLDCAPTCIAGHSAGAAVAVQMTLSEGVRPAALVLVNPALAPFPGSSSSLFPILSGAVFLNPLTTALIARAARSTERVRRLLDSTGSVVEPEGLELYRRLLSDPQHVEGTFAMMVHWDLRPLRRALRQVEPATLVLVGERDGTVPPEVGRAVAGEIPGARMEVFADAGHLLHEEQPERTWETIRAYLQDL